jgi:hypothetical protein
VALLVEVRNEASRFWTLEAFARSVYACLCLSMSRYESCR